MPITSSRVKEGVLTFGPVASSVDFSCQPSNIRLTPTTESEDPLETLCGDIATGSGTTSWVLQGTAISDFDDPDGFVLYCFEHDGEQVEFSWQPNAVDNVWSGELFIQAVEIGGDVNTRLTTDFTFSVVSTPTYTPEAVTPLTAEAATTDQGEPDDGEGEGEPPEEPSPESYGIPAP